MSRTIVIADASCLIALDNIGELNLLQRLYSEITITPEVASEYGLGLPIWITIRSPFDTARVDELRLTLDRGEASTIILAMESLDCLLIIDEKKGRRIAEQAGLRIIGTIGVIARGLDAGLLDSPSDISARLNAIGFRVSDSVKDQIFGRIN